MHYSPPDWRELEPVYCDEFLLVIDKPAGLLSVSGRGADKQDCLASRIQRQFPDALIVHRLDMATSGLLAFARGADMQRRLSTLFRERSVEKRYVAVLAGALEPETGEVDLPIAADWPNRPRRMIDTGLGKPSLTRYRVLARDADSSRVELEPVTGRTHQLRVHMQALGHPIIGDGLYGGPVADRLMLHAAELIFAHPADGHPVRCICEPPF